MSDKSTASIAQLEDWLARANELKVKLENEVARTEACVNKIREKHPALPPAKPVSDFDSYNKLNANISRITKIIENYKNDNK